MSASPSNIHPKLQVAVIGAGVAGAACAHALHGAGHQVRVFDKSRGPGGRMATRRVLWVDAEGRGRSTRFDHGAPGFAAHTPAFRDFTRAGLQAGWLVSWAPRGCGAALDAPGTQESPVQPVPQPSLKPLMAMPAPDMPTLCRHLLQGIDTQWACQVETLQYEPQGWQLQQQGSLVGEGFDAVVLALPPAQAGALLAAHNAVWARQAAMALMQPCWTLMGVADAPLAAPHWDVARPLSGPLAWLQRNDGRPGREQRAGEAHWVLHARPAWSRQHLEHSAEVVQAAMQAALADWLGEPVHWRYAVTHRWRYATVQALAPEPSGSCWWDAGAGLAACGDFLGGRGGVEGAWLSAQALATQMLAQPPTARRAGV